MEIFEERTHGRGAMARKEAAKGQEKGVKGDTRTCWTCGKSGHIAAWCRKEGNNNLYGIDEEESEAVKEQN